MAQGERPSSRTHPERVARGERHGNAKLTEAQVRWAITEHDSGRMSQQEIAATLNVSFQLVHLLVRRKIWRHLTVP